MAIISALRDLRRDALLSIALVLALLAALISGPARAAGDWILPVPDAEVVRGLDLPEQDWQPGHRGVDLSAAPGDAVLSPAAGTVHFAGAVAGRRVITIAIGDRLSSFEPVSSDLRRGDAVEAGQRIGTVEATPQHCAARGCVHWGVRESGRYVDPLALVGVSAAARLLPRDQKPEPRPEPPAGGGSGAGPWGGHANGRIPAGEMCPLGSAPHHRLRCDAAEGFDALNAAFRKAFGRSIAVTDGYRDYGSQVRLKRQKGRMAATPGRSNHGWGLALDLGGGINRFGTREHAWMRENAPAHGWIHPAWAQANGSLPEPWHWEWSG